MNPRRPIRPARLGALMLAAWLPLLAWPSPAVGQGTEPSFATIAALDELTENHASIFRLYEAYFDREPDVAGALYWVEQHDRCLPLGVISELFANSPEFVNSFGRLDAIEFVELVYTQVLDRAGDPGGLQYWSGLITSGLSSRGSVMLHISMSTEFRSRHPHPSDGVPNRACRTDDETPTRRDFLTIALGSPAPMASVAGLDLALPAMAVERVGFHQSTHPGALAMEANASAPFTFSTMQSRRRGTVSTGAADVAVHPIVSIHSPIAGTVARAGEYTLYCRYSDGFVVIHPDAAPHLELKMLHMQGVSVSAGDRVAVGDQVAARATPFPFRSQIDDLTAEPSWPHVHIEVVDPSIPRTGSSGSC